MSYSDRFSACYLRAVRSEIVIGLLTDLATATGMSLTFPGTSSVAIISDCGEQSMISIDEFMQFVNDSPVVRFQYWWSDADDVYCRLQREYDLTCLEFALEGTTTEQEQKIWDCLKPLFISLTEHSVALLLILDRIGRTFEYQWKEIALGQIQLVGPYPDEMIVPTTFECLKSLDATQMQCIQLTPRAIAIRSTM